MRLNRPLRSLSLICCNLLSTLQFDKQDLKWSLPHGKQPAASWGREFPLYVDTSRELQQSAPPASGVQDPPLPKPKVKEPAGNWWSPRLEEIERSLQENSSHPAVHHLLMYPATSFSRLWAKRWLRKRSWPWGRRRLSRTSTRLLFSRTCRKKDSSSNNIQTCCASQPGFCLNVMMPSEAGAVLVHRDHTQTTSILQILKMRTFCSWFLFLKLFYLTGIKIFLFLLTFLRSESAVSAWNCRRCAQQWRESLTQGSAGDRCGSFSPPLWLSKEKETCF